jgi:outer membrane protein
LDLIVKSLIATAILTLTASAAWSADQIAPIDQSDIDLVFEIGAGGRYQPTYEGSDEYEVSAFPIIGVGYLNIPGLFEIGSVSPQGGGLSFGPSFNYISERDFDDDPDLFGLNEVDGTFEAGIKAKYEWDFAEVWGEARYAFGGADGVVGGFGANAVLKPTDTLTVKAGPFATLASEGYMNDYFGVSALESAATGVAAYDAGGGFKSVGVEASVRYEFSENWFLNGEASYSKIVGDAADSPIVQFGNEDQFTVGLGISRRFAVDLF